MKGYDEKFFSELKSKNDIVDVVGHYVRLEQRGMNFWGKCPFHHEKTASFCVNSVGNFYYCFGCHKSGDVISFIMEMESLDFGDAIKFLADRAKIPLPELKIDDEKIREHKEKKARSLEILKESALFYVGNLKKPQADKHLEYILKRGFTQNTVVKFGMGASFDFNGLPNYLREKGYSYEEMLTAGVVGEKNGRYFDWLGGRLIIPIIDQFNNVIAFDGRRIDDVKENKYLNTRETVVFSKGRTLFSINNLKKEKQSVGIDSVIIVEGHLDVVSLVQAGVNNVVASMGTAFTKDQARIIKCYSDKVFISFDGDFAGQKASIKGLEILKDEGLDVKVVSLPDGLDPDDVIKKFGEKGYRDLLSKAMPLIDFKLDVLRRTFDINSVDGRRKFISNAVRVIRESDSPAEQEDLLKTVRDLTGVTFDALKRELYSTQEKEIKTEEPRPVFTDNVGDKEVLASRFILASYLFKKPFAFEYDIENVEFNSQVYKDIQRYLAERKTEISKINFNDLYEIVSEEDKEELSRLAGLLAEEKKDFNEAQYFTDCVRTLKVSAIDREIERLTLLVKTETDSDKRRELTVELLKLSKRKKEIV